MTPRPRTERGSEIAARFAAHGVRYLRLDDVPPWFTDDEVARCRWCGAHPLPTGRRAWCSTECRNEYLIRSSGKFIREQVTARDGGRCCDCGFDAVERHGRVVDVMHRLLLRPLRPSWKPDGSKAYGYGLRHCGAVPGLCRCLWHRLARWVEGRGLPKLDPNQFPPTWHEIDHVTPVSEGGGCCGLDGLRTLCLPCHKRHTAMLAARNGARRASDSASRRGGPPRRSRRTAPGRKQVRLF